MNWELMIWIIHQNQILINKITIRNILIIKLIEKVILMELLPIIFTDFYNKVLTITPAASMMIKILILEVKIIKIME